MERIKLLLEHAADSAKIKGHEDIELVINSLVGAIEKDCVDELADYCFAFLERKAYERMVIEN